MRVARVASADRGSNRSTVSLAGLSRRDVVATRANRREPRLRCRVRNAARLRGRRSRPFPADANRRLLPSRALRSRRPDRRPRARMAEPPKGLAVGSEVCRAAPGAGETDSMRAPAPVCPECRGSLSSSRQASFVCNSCQRSYPHVAGLPDLRLESDRYLDLDAEREKAACLHRVEAEPGADVMALARAYYTMADDVVDHRRDLFLRHIAGAEMRGEPLAERLPRDGAILEVGCGTGGLPVAAARSGRSIVGVDIASRWLVVARRRLTDHGYTVPLIAAQAERLPWPGESFDVVVADSLLEHLDDPTAALCEWGAGCSGRVACSCSGRRIGSHSRRIRTWACLGWAGFLASGLVAICGLRAPRRMCCRGRCLPSRRIGSPAGPGLARVSARGRRRSRNAGRTSRPGTRAAADRSLSTGAKVTRCEDAPEHARAALGASRRAMQGGRMTGLRVVAADHARGRSAASAAARATAEGPGLGVCRRGGGERVRSRCARTSSEPLGPSLLARVEYAAVVAALAARALCARRVDEIIYREAARRVRLVAPLTDLLIGLRLIWAVVRHAVVLTIAALVGPEKGRLVAAAGLTLFISTWVTDVGPRNRSGRLSIRSPSPKSRGSHGGAGPVFGLVRCSSRCRVRGREFGQEVRRSRRWSLLFTCTGSGVVRRAADPLKPQGGRHSVRAKCQQGGAIAGLDACSGDGSVALTCSLWDGGQGVTWALTPPRVASSLRSWRSVWSGRPRWRPRWRGRGRSEGESRGSESVKACVDSGC